MQNVTPEQLTEELLINSKAGLCSMVWGPPGIGKSQIAYQVGTKLGAKVYELRANLFDPIDVRGGLKVVYDGERGSYVTRYGTPEDFPDTDMKEPVVLLVDELPNAPKATQNALLQLLLDRKIGQYTLPENTTIIAAGNRAQDRAAVHDMPTPVANRFSHFTLETRPDDWFAWASANGIDHRLVSFLRFAPKNLHNMDVKEKAFPTPRSWAFVNDRMNVVNDPSKDFVGVSSLVGEGAAHEFVAFMRIAAMLPNLDKIIASPGTASVPTKQDVLYALTGALMAKCDSKNFDDIMKFVKRIPAEFQVAFIKDVAQRDRAVIATKAFTEWTEHNQDIL